MLCSASEEKDFSVATPGTESEGSIFSDVCDSEK